MIITQWTPADTAFVNDTSYSKAALDELVDPCAEGPVFGDEYAVTLDAEMVAELNRERELNGNLSGDPIARGLTCEEEDAEVGRIWGIDASRLSDGE